MSYSYCCPALVLVTPPSYPPFLQKKPHNHPQCTLPSRRAAPRASRCKRLCWTWPMLRPCPRLPALRWWAQQRSASAAPSQVSLQSQCAVPGLTFVMQTGQCHVLDMPGPFVALPQISTPTRHVSRVVHAPNYTSCSPCKGQGGLGLHLRLPGRLFQVLCRCAGTQVGQVNHRGSGQVNPSWSEGISAACV